MKIQNICVFGGGSLYRLPIYNQMANELGCHFYIMEEDPSKGIKTYDFNLLKNFKGLLKIKKLYGGFYWQKNTISLITKPYDLYIVGSPFCISYWCLILLAKFSNKKVASWSHGFYGREKLIRKAIKKLYFNLCDVNFVYNDRSIQLMNKSGISNSKIFRVGNSLDTITNLKIRNSLEKKSLYSEIFKNNYFTLIFVGRVTKEKRLDLILESMKILQMREFFVNLVIVGKDVDGVNLNSLIKLYNLQNFVHLYGPCYDESVLGELFYNADICVSPGNVGLTAINSLTFGCPVITHDNFNFQGPEFEAICPGVTGDFFKQDDSEDLANKIFIWLENKKSQDREIIREHAFNEVDTRWNIFTQIQVFKESINSLK